MNRNIRNASLMAALIAGAISVPAFAQTTGTEVQRDVNQQQRIEQGLKSGQLSTKEASQLEHGEAKIDKMQSNALKDGNVSATEKARIQAAQNRESAKIAADKTNGVTGNPNSASSQRMQADVQRNVNQQTRIEQGVKSGSLTKRETASAERGQARVDRSEARAGANGHVSAGEQAGIQARENHQSRKIHREKTNDVKRG